MHGKTGPRIAVMISIVFIVINAISFCVLSDGHGVTQVHDGIVRVGWPLLIFEEGGFIWRREFYLTAAFVDLVFAACIAVIFHLGWAFLARAGWFRREGV